LALRLAGFEIFGAVCIARLEAGVTVGRFASSRDALRPLIPARHFAGFKFLGALINGGCEHHHQAAGKREDRQAYFAFHARSFSDFHQGRLAK
jgi:hypothetical protein